MDPFTGAALISGLFNLGGGIFGGIGQGKSQEKDRQLQRELANKQMQLQRDTQGLAASQLNPLAQQAARQKMAMMAAIAPQLRNVQVSSAVPGMNRFIPQIQGGLRLPEGGFSPETLNFFSPQAMQGAEEQFWKQARPFVPQAPNMQSVGYPAPQPLAGNVPQGRNPNNDAILRALQMGGRRGLDV